MDFKKLKGKKVSILIQGLHKKEAYVGIIESVDGDFIDLKLLQSNPLKKQQYPLERILIRTNIVESIWIYSSNTNTNTNLVS